MKQGLRRLVAVGVRSQESLLQPLDTGIEEGLDLMVQIEESEAYEAGCSPTDCRLTDASDPCHE